MHNIFAPATLPAITDDDFTSLAPHPLVARLESDRNESGYYCVYRASGCCPPRWLASVRMRGVDVDGKPSYRKTRLKGSASRLPHQAALYVVLWYQKRYGARWMRVLGQRVTGRGRKPWRVWQRRGGGWAARVWERGKPVEVTGERRDGRAADEFDTLENCVLTPRKKRRKRRRKRRTSARLLVFATREEAVAAVRAWERLRWGEHPERAVWRW